MRWYTATHHYYSLTLIVSALIVFGSNACIRQPSSSEAVQAPAASEKTCRNDGDCQGGFCDRGVCQTPAGVYGRACKPAPRTPDGPREGKQNTCGAYLCIDERCRSCQSDKECQSELGAPRCYKLKGEPGARCGNPSS